MHTRPAPLNPRQRAALCAYAQSYVAPRHSDPAAWFALALVLRHASVNGLPHRLRDTAKSSRDWPCLIACPPPERSSPDIEIRLFALFAE